MIDLTRKSIGLAPPVRLSPGKICARTLQSGGHAWKIGRGIFLSSDVFPGKFANFSGDLGKFLHFFWKIRRLFRKICFFKCLGCLKFYWKNLQAFPKT